VVLELSAGEKRSHWMWFVFPQLRDWGTACRRISMAWARLRRLRLTGSIPCWAAAGAVHAAGEPGGGTAD